MRSLRLILPILGAAVLVTMFIGCESVSPYSGAWDARLGAVPTTPITPLQLLQEANVKQDLIPFGTVGRKYYRPMKTQYITIHATENSTGDAWHHALALKRGALTATRRVGGNRIGFLTWHFTVQDDSAYQHLPTNEQGEHADFDGPGNNFSVGIEMCEHHGNDLPRTIENTAKLAAFLMYEHHIPISNVVPHYHWRRISVNPEHKPCPHFLLDRGRPGPTWNWFLGRVMAHYQRIVPGPMPRI
jgi:N-acetylmuramoyl-L-alanine amidase